MALSILTVIGLILLKLSLNIIYPRQWALGQTITDAYLTFERSKAQRIPFEALTAANSPWPDSTSAINVATTTNVVLGRLPGNRTITGTLARTRFADPGNEATDGSNPAAMKIWRVQSVLTYQIGGRNYIKSRTVIRAQ